MLRMGEQHLKALVTQLVYWELTLRGMQQDVQLLLMVTPLINGHYQHQGQQSII